MNKMVKECRPLKFSITEIIISAKHNCFTKNRHMKKFIIIILAITAMAQTYAQSTLSASADYKETPTMSLSWTIGEPVTETVSDGTNMLTQGFHQSKLTVTAIKTQTANEVFYLYPNPTQELINISGISMGSKFVIYDISGKVVSNGILQTNSINLSSLNAGIYIVEMKSQKIRVIKE